MDLKTSYLGLELKNPLIVSASPLCQTLDNIRRMEESGAAAVVLHSLFEEQIMREEKELDKHLSQGTESFAESLTYFPAAGEFLYGPEAYLEHVRKAKKAVKIPVIASLNGRTVGSWMKYAKLIQQAGADALELNIYSVPSNSELTGPQVEDGVLDIVRAVKKTVTIPVAVKLSPFFSSLSSMARRLDGEGVDALVLFNRFYQPDIDLEEKEVVPRIHLSTAMDLRLPLRWVAILHGRVKAKLAATGGIHEASDALKAVLAGADAVQLCSTLYKNGLAHIGRVLKDMTDWMTKHEYASVGEMRGVLSLKKCPNAEAFERGVYVHAVKSDSSIMK